MVAGNAWVCGSRNRKLLTHSLADQEEEMSVCAQLTSPLPLSIYLGEPSPWDGSSHIQDGSSGTPLILFRNTDTLNGVPSQTSWHF